MTTTPSELAALDFPAPVIPCEQHADDAPPPVRYRITYTCGCVDLACTAHAEATQEAHFAALARVAVLGCQECLTVPILVRSIEAVDQ
jgi:hypothetical protein